MNLLLLAQIPMALTQLTLTALARHKWLLMKDKTIKAHQPLPTRGSSRTERRMLALRPWQGAFSWTGEHSILDAECLAEQNGGLCRRYRFMDERQNGAERSETATRGCSSFLQPLSQRR
jgi:hypothetical protein